MDAQILLAWWAILKAFFMVSVCFASNNVGDKSGDIMPTIVYKVNILPSCNFNKLVSRRLIR